MQYDWRTVKIIHDERVNQLLEIRPERESIWSLWWQRRSGRIGRLVNGLLRQRPPAPAPRYEPECQPETAV